MNKRWLLCIGFLLRAEVLFWLLELGVHAVKRCAELPALDKAPQTRGSGQWLTSSLWRQRCLNHSAGRNMLL